MAKRNISLIDRLSKKNILDTVILGVVTILMVAIILFVEDKTMMISFALIILFLYFTQYQFSRNELINILLDYAIDNSKVK